MTPDPPPNPSQRSPRATAGDIYGTLGITGLFAALLLLCFLAEGWVRDWSVRHALSAAASVSVSGFFVSTLWSLYKILPHAPGWLRRTLRFECTRKRVRAHLFFALLLVFGALGALYLRALHDGARDYQSVALSGYVPVPGPAGMIFHDRLANVRYCCMSQQPEHRPTHWVQRVMYEHELKLGQDAMMKRGWTAERILQLEQDARRGDPLVLATPQNSARLEAALTTFTYLSRRSRNAGVVFDDLPSGLQVEIPHSGEARMLNTPLTFAVQDGTLWLNNAQPLFLENTQLRWMLRADATVRVVTPGNFLLSFPKQPRWLPKSFLLTLGLALAAALLLLAPFHYIRFRGAGEIASSKTGSPAPATPAEMQP